MNVIPDTIDLSRYIQSDDDISSRVRPASDFTEKLHAEFAPHDQHDRKPEMFSTKLRGVIEFRPGEVTCWAGFSGHRKSTFTGQVALDLVVQKQRMLIASFEMQPERTMARMTRQALGLATPPAWQIDRFAQWTKDKLWIFDHFGKINPARCLAVCRYFAEELQGQHVVIDSMMMVCASEDRLDEQKQFMTDLVRMAQETGMHVHLVAHCRKPAQGGEEKPPTKYDLRGSAAITDQAQNVIMVWLDKAKKAKAEAFPLDGEDAEKPDALVTVEKQRNGRWEGRVRLWFDDPSMRFTDSRLTTIEPYILSRAPTHLEAVA